MYYNNVKEGIKSRYTITWFVSYENTHAYIAPSLYQHHAFQMYSTISRYICILTQCSMGDVSIGYIYNTTIEMSLFVYYTCTLF